MNDENPYLPVTEQLKPVLRFGRRPAVTLDTYDGPGADDDDDEADRYDAHEDYDRDSGLSGYDTNWSY